MTGYTVQSPVLLLIFNRPDTTQAVFDRVRHVRPSRLYIAADGARPDRIGEEELCQQARAIAGLVHWPCELKTLFRSSNLGCKQAVSTAINWFFENEEEGIILEDDCLPADDFFYFCDNLLERYRSDDRVRSVTGTNQQEGRKWGDASYYFSQCSNIWGWASWRRTWKKYDPYLLSYDEAEIETQLQKVFSDRFIVSEWVRLFRDVKSGKIDTWDYQFHLVNFFENGLCATPNVNLVSNIGFRPDATHTTNPLDHSAALPTGTLKEITHPVYFLPEKEADYFLLKKHFHIDEKWTQFWKDQLPRRRFKKWLRNLFGN